MVTRIGKKQRVYNFYDQLDYPPYEYQEYPKMLYHPKGETKVVAQGEVQATAWGPELRNQKFEIITKIVNNLAEEKAALAEGWHKTLEESTAAAVAAQAPKSSSKTSTSATA